VKPQHQNNSNPVSSVPVLCQFYCVFLRVFTLLMLGDRAATDCDLALYFFLLCNALYFVYFFCVLCVLFLKEVHMIE
jgi:hypothetical protein